MKYKFSFVATLAVAAVCLFSMTGAASAQSYATANYTEQGGSVWDVGGSIVLKSGGSLISNANSLMDVNPAFSANILGNPVSKVLVGNATLAQVNAGATILNGVTGRKIYVTNAKLQAVGGSAATCTAVVLQDTAGSPVNVLSVPVADLTSGATVEPFGASVTMGAAYGAGGLTSGKGLAIAKTGSSCATATSFNYAITYVVQ